MMSTFKATWVGMPEQWVRAFHDFFNAVIRDASENSSSRDAFTPALVELRASLRMMRIAREAEKPVAEVGQSAVTAGYRKTAQALIDTVMRDCEGSDASRDRYACLLDRLDAAATATPEDELADELSSVREFLASGLSIEHAIERGKISETALMAALKRAVDGAPAKPLHWRDVALAYGATAATEFGSYQVKGDSDGGRWELALGALANEHVTLFLSVHPSQAQARAAGQADFNERVQASLTSSIPLNADTLLADPADSSVPPKVHIRAAHP